MRSSSLLKCFVLGDQLRSKVVNFLALGFLSVFGLLLILSFWVSGIYSNRLGVNVAVVGDDGVALALVRPSEEHLVWIKLPLAMQIKIAGSDAVYPVFSLWKFASSEKKPLDLVARSLEYTIGVPLPMILKVDDKLSPESLLRALRSIGLRSNITVRDRILLGRDVLSLVSGKKVLEVDVPKTAMTKQSDPDGVEFLEVNNVISLWTKNYFVFESLLGENVEVRVFNLSDTPGSATVLAKKMESAGIKVVEVTSDYTGPKLNERGCVFTSSKDNQAVDTFYVINNYLSCKFINRGELQKRGEIGVWIL